MIIVQPIIFAQQESEISRRLVIYYDDLVENLFDKYLDKSYDIRM